MAQSWSSGRSTATIETRLRRSTCRRLAFVICLVLVAQLAVAISIGVRPSRDVPRTRIGLVIVGILLACGLARIRYEL